MLNNNAGKYVQCLVWGDDTIEAVRDKIQLNKVGSVVLFVSMYIHILYILNFSIFKNKTFEYFMI